MAVEPGAAVAGHPDALDDEGGAEFLPAIGGRLSAAHQKTEFAISQEISIAGRLNGFAICDR